MLKLFFDVNLASNLQMVDIIYRTQQAYLKILFEPKPETANDNED